MSSDDSPDDEEVYPFLIDAPDNRGQHDFCKNLLVNLFRTRNQPMQSRIPRCKNQKTNY